MSYQSIHVLGERNCGTNYLLQLLKKNVNIPVYDTQLVHKHFIFDKSIIERHPDTLFLVITKELHHFLKALYNAPHHITDVPLNENGISSYKNTDISIKSFLTSQITSDIRFANGRPDVKYKYSNSFETNENPVELYYDKLLFYLSLRVNNHQNVDYIKYEELNNGPEMLIELLKKYNIRTLSSQIENVEFYKSDKGTKYTPTKYHQFNDEELELIEILKNNAINKLILDNDGPDTNFNYDSEKYYLPKYTICNNVESNQIKSIPKLIHFIWIGSKIPEKYIQSIRMCLTQNPSWTIFLWVDDNNINKTDIGVDLKHINEIDLIAQESYNFINNYGFKADILRLEIIHAYGGIYSDIDSYWTKPLSHIFEYEFVNYRDDFRLKNISNSLFGFSKENCILKTILLNLNTHLQHCRNVIGVSKSFVPIYSGPSMFTHFIDKYFKNTYKMNYIHQSFCMLSGLHQAYTSCYRHYGNYPDISFTYQTFDGNW